MSHFNSWGSISSPVSRENKTEQLWNSASRSPRTSARCFRSWLRAGGSPLPHSHFCARLLDVGFPSILTERRAPLCWKELVFPKDSPSRKLLWLPDIPSLQRTRAPAATPSQAQHRSLFISKTDFFFFFLATWLEVNQRSQILVTRGQCSPSLVKTVSSVLHTERSHLPNRNNAVFCGLTSGPSQRKSFYLSLPPDSTVFDLSNFSLFWFSLSISGAPLFSRLNLWNASHCFHSETDFKWKLLSLISGSVFLLFFIKRA